ncbi:uncharacterized protein LOC129322571 [Prosopis cineraria]|uniref:uncharacterized protein LOC129322571 n=1 Tax=Prosopis cineraria TaxID=364024 RepID=UPI00240F5180|nr:uncharacterized protein LOC129322571 [Prosopis cineraria]
MEPDQNSDSNSEIIQNVVPSPPSSTSDEAERKRKRRVIHLMPRKRARWRKMVHVENLRCEVESLRSENNKLHRILKLNFESHLRVLEDNSKLRIGPMEMIKTRRLISTRTKSTTMGTEQLTLIKTGLSTTTETG